MCIAFKQEKMVKEQCTKEQTAVSFTIFRGKQQELKKYYVEPAGSRQAMYAKKGKNGRKGRMFFEKRFEYEKKE